jgi:O-antigen/teichoic acid export membrane protein
MANEATMIGCRTTLESREPSPTGSFFARTAMDQIRRDSVRGGFVSMGAQALRFVLQTTSVIIMAHLLTPQDFGLQGMVLAMAGILALFSDVGLGMATIQREEITHEQTSTLFWINVGLGATLAVLAAALAPALVVFYHEPRLFWMTIVFSMTFLIGGFGAQHSALLVREMRFATRAKIDISALLLSLAVGAGMAWFRFGYWSLVGMAVTGPIVSVAGMWLAVRWVPGLPQRGCGLRSMVHFGGMVTLNNLVVYVGYNTEKILLGRYWGADALGLYGRAYSLVNLPTAQLHSAIWNVAFPALSRLQSNPLRLRNAFLKGYAIIVSLTIPVTICCILFAEDIIRIALGPKWNAAIPIFRLLGPTVLALGLINPFGWFLTATGRVGRSLSMAFVIAPLVIVGVAIGLRFGPKGVAFAYSTVMTLLLVPLIAWATHGTGITATDYWKTVKPPVLSGFLAAVAGWAFISLSSGALIPIGRLILGVGLVMGLYAWVLLFAMGQKSLYMDLAKQVFHRSPTH